MKYLLYVVVLFSLAPSFAQAQTASTYVPITINEQDYTKLQTYLGDVPAKYANPIIGFLAHQEEMAAMKPAKEKNAVKPPEPSKVAK